MELRSFAAAAAELALSKATVSKAVTRLEQRLGARLFNRTSRRLALTDAGQKLSERAARLLLDGEAAENEALAQSAAPRGLVRLAVPMTFGVKAVAPLLPEFLAQYPEVSIDLHLSDAMVDLIGEGFDAGLRIASLPDSSLIARRLCAMPRYTVASPAYLKQHGRPTHPMHLAQHKCLGYTYLSTPGIWHYTNSSGEQASVRPAGPLRVNNGEALMPALLAGLGIADLPDFIVGDAIASGDVEVILKDWKQTEGAVHLVTPPGGPRPARVEVLAEFLAKQLGKSRVTFRGKASCAVPPPTRIELAADEVARATRLAHPAVSARLRSIKPRSPGRKPPMNRRELLKAAAVLPLRGAAVESRSAQATPSRNITMIVPFPAGGQADLAARPVALALERILGKPVIVDNRAGGGGGSVGNAQAARAEPDGYTLLMTLSSLAVLPEADRLFDRPVAYEVSQFAPVARVLADPTLLAVPARRRGRRCRISSTTPKSAQEKFPTARPVPTARCMWRWKCSPPAPASSCCTCRFAVPVRR